jgi:uncharacterized membrane protein YfcA
VSIPLLIGLLAFIIVIGAAAGVWRARDRGANTQQSSILLLLVVVGAVLLAWFILRGR